MTKWQKINIKHKIKVKIPYLISNIKLIPVAISVKIEKNKRLFFISGFLKKLILFTNLIPKSTDCFYYPWILRVIFYFHADVLYIPLRYCHLQTLQQYSNFFKQSVSRQNNTFVVDKNQ